MGSNSTIIFYVDPLGDISQSTVRDVHGLPKVPTRDLFKVLKAFGVWGFRVQGLRV